MPLPRKARNITRYTYEKTSFQGWRLCICRAQRQYTRYFSDKVFGGEEEAFKAALGTRDGILKELRATPGDIEGIFAHFR